MAYAREKSPKGMEIVQDAGNAPQSKEFNQPSLQELCTGKALTLVLDPEKFTDSDFAVLPPGVQRMLFAKMRTEMNVLRHFKGNVDKYCPDIDTKLYQFPPSLPLCDIGLPVWSSFFPERDEFRRLWSYECEYDIDQEDFSLPGAHWYEGNLVAHNPDSELRFEEKNENLHSSNGHFHFYQRISSQLLLFRLVCMFDLPPPKSNIGNVFGTWDIVLYYRWGPSRLRLNDHLGQVKADYAGTVEASGEALKLLNFLCGMKIPYGEEGAIAGVPFGSCAPAIGKTQSGESESGLA